jgi:hypothetical protein
MAGPGETEVFRIELEVGKCYEHVEATRDVYAGGGNHRYFTTNVPRYVGRYTETKRYGYGDGGSAIAYFYDSSTKRQNQVSYSYAGYTCFREVPCIIGPEERRGHAVASFMRAQPPTNLNAVQGLGEGLGELLSQDKRAGSRRRKYRKKPSKTRRKKCKCKN